MTSASAPACEARSRPRIVRRVPYRTEFALTAPETPAETLLDRLRRATIGRYEVYAELGVGGMATVFLARDLALDRKVAIKVMSPLLVSAPGSIERFRREARVAAALSHPNIVPIHAIGEEPGLAYYVMKFIEGRTLDSVVRAEGAQDLTFVQSIIGYVGGALHYAHQRGVVHRDVKPANIMLDIEGWTYVTDFGIAKQEEGHGLTHSGVIIGTPNYMCPEQFNGVPLTGAADQYALGIVAYELLAGMAPYNATSIGEVMRGHLFDPLPPLRSVRPDVPELLESCVARMLEKDPAKRFPSIADAVSAFGTISSSAERASRKSLAALAAAGVRELPDSRVPTTPNAQRPPVDEMASAAATRKMTPPWSDTVARAARRRRLGIGLRLLLLVMIMVAVALPVDVQWWSSVGVPAGMRWWSSVVVPAAARWWSEDAVTAQGPPPAGAAARVGDTVPSGGNSNGVLPAELILGTPKPVVGQVAPVDADSAARRAAPAPAPTRSVRERLADRRSATGRAPVGTAHVRIGSRIPLSVLYVNGRTRGVIGQRGVLDVTVPAGTVRLSIRAENCVSWDTVFTARASQRYVIGNRGPRC